MAHRALWALYYWPATSRHTSHAHTHTHTHLFISEFGEGVHDDTKHDVEANGGDNDEECDIKEESDPGIIRITSSNLLQGVMQKLSTSVEY